MPNNFTWVENILTTVVIPKTLTNKDLRIGDVVINGVSRFTVRDLYIGVSGEDCFHPKEDSNGYITSFFKIVKRERVKRVHTPGWMK